MKSIGKVGVNGKKVFVRVDFDVPLEDGKVVDDFRIRMCLPTLNYLLDHKAKLILATKLGRPSGKKVSKLSTGHIKSTIEDLLGTSNFTLLENLRFDPREAEESEEFGRELAGMADIYVNECFATSHRGDTSLTQIPRFIPGFAGFRLIKEVEILSNVLKSPKRPFVFVVGGAKMESKLPVIKNLLSVADKILVGGKIGFVDLPDNVKVESLRDDIDGFDIGPNTINDFVKEIKGAKTVVWAGPMGKFEEEKYELGTRRVAEAIATSRAFRIVGGGDTLSSLDKFNLRAKMDFVSTGGGAMLDFLAGKKLPGLEALGYYG